MAEYILFAGSGNPALAGAVIMRAGFTGQAMLVVVVGAAATLMFALVARRAAPLLAAPVVTK